MQNVVDLESGRTLQPYTDYLDALAYHFAPGAKRALILGLGAGVLPRSLARRGLEVTAVDLDARVEEVARRFFDLPSGVRVEIADGRALLRRSRDTYDLVFIDAFAGESAPWHLLTVEAFAEAAERLGPGGRLVVNIVTMGRGETLGLARVKAGLRQVFPAARVFLGQAEQASGVDLRNAILVAGLDLEASGESRRPQDAALAAALDSLLPGHPADVTVLPATDDWSDLDYSDAAVRALYRSMVVQVTPPAGQ
jgi:SAM-dependent methyltransferase